MNVFDLKARISLDSSAYEAELSKARGSTESFGSTLSDKLGAAVSKIGDVLANVGAKVGDFLKDSVATGMEFDSAMSQVAATLGTTVDEIGNLREFAMQMGAETKYTSTEAAEALNYMALAGYDAATSMEMLPNVLNLAAAGNMALAKASDMVTDAQTAFGISNERTVQMIDEMAKASTSGNTTVEQLGEAMLKIGALAKETNGGFVTLSDGTKAAVDNIQELEIAFTAMASASIKGSEAGTHMRNMIMSLTKDGEASNQAWEEMGELIGKTADQMRFDASGSVRSLKDVFQDLQKAFDKVGSQNQQQKLKWIGDIFNVRDETSLMSLLDAVSNSSWDSLGEAILNAEGAAEKMKEVQLDNLAGDVDKMKSAFDNLKISISDSFTGPLRDGVQMATEWIGNFQDYVEIFQANGLGQALKAIGWDLEETFGNLGQFLPSEEDILEGLNAVFDIGGKIWGKIKEGLYWALNNFGGLASTAGDIIFNLSKRLTDKANLDQLLDLETGVPAIIRKIGEGLLDFIGGENRDGEGGLVGAARGIVTKLREWISDPDNREKIYDAAKDILNTLGKGLVNFIGILLPFVWELATTLATMIDGMVTDALKRLFNPVKSMSDVWFSGSNEAMEEWLKSGDTGQFEDWYREHYGLDVHANDEWLGGGEQAWRDQFKDEMEEQYRGSKYSMPTGEAYEQAYKRWRENGGHFATGGIVTRPTYALIGESGAEAVMPLEHNTGWIRELAQELGGGGQTVIQFGDIYVNGDEDAGHKVAEQIDRALRDLQIQQARGIGGTAWKR